MSNIYLYLYLDLELDLDLDLDLDLNTYIPTYLHTYIPAYLHTCIPAYLHTCIPAYPHSKELFSGITGTCILHSRATLDDPVFSSDHPALSFEHHCFFWCFLLFSFFLYQCVFCNRWSTLTPRYGPKASGGNLSSAWVAPKNGSKLWEEAKRNNKKHKGTS